MIQENKRVLFFDTKDKVTASILYATGQALDSHWFERNVCFFRFENKDKCEQIMMDYFNNKLVFNIKVFVEALNTISSILYGSSK